MIALTEFWILDVSKIVSIKKSTVQYTIDRQIALLLEALQMTAPNF